MTKKYKFKKIIGGKKMKKFLLGILLLLLLITSSCFNTVTESDKKDPATNDPVILTPEIDVVTGATKKVNNATYHFGNFSTTDSPVTRDVTIKNIDIENFEISGISLSTGTSFSLSDLPASYPVSLDSDESITVKLTYDPSVVAGEINDVLTINNSFDDPFVINIKGNSTVSPAGSEIDVSIDSDISNGSTYNFGSFIEGASSVTKTVTISNSGSTDLNISEIKLSGAGYFSLSNVPSIPATVLPGVANSITFSVTFNPSTIGSHTAVITIDNNDGNGDESPFTINLSGTVTSSSPPPVINIKVDGSDISNNGTTDFGAVAAGSSEQTKTMIIENPGTDPLVINKIGLNLIRNDLYEISFPSTPVTIQPGDNITCDIKFKPSVNQYVIGTIKELIVITYNTDKNYKINLNGDLTPSTGDYTVELDFESNGSYMVYACWIEDEAGNNIQNFYICNTILGIGKGLTGDAIPNWLTKKYKQNNDVDGVTGASIGNSTSNKYLNASMIYNSPTTRKFRIYFEVDRSWNGNTYFYDRPAFIYQSDLIDLDNFDQTGTDYNFILYGWMSNGTKGTGSLSQEPKSPISNWDTYTLMAGTANVPYIEADGLDPMVQSLKITVKKQ